MAQNSKLIRRAKSHEGPELVPGKPSFSPFCFRVMHFLGLTFLWELISSTAPFSLLWPLSLLASLDAWQA
jgi:hypothetical protein